MTKRGDKDLTAIGELPLMKALAKQFKPPTPNQIRMVDAAVALTQRDRETQEVLFQHSVFCQTSLPHSDPGSTVREWERRNGTARLLVKAGEAMHPTSGEFVRLGLPYGPKCRLILMHCNQQALLTQSPHIEVEATFTAFVRKFLKLDSNGRTVNAIRAQITKLAGASMTLGTLKETEQGTRAKTDNIQIVRSFDVWMPKNEKQQVLWPGFIEYSADYFESLLTHAVPVDEVAITALSDSAMALDIYCWLAQRLHRIPEGKPAFVSWLAVWEQFGAGYNPNRMDNFRRKFKEQLHRVLQVYDDAKNAVGVDEQSQKHLPAVATVINGRVVRWRNQPATGLTLRHAKPPVPYRLRIVQKP